MLNSRQATPAEIIAQFDHSIKSGEKVQYRGFLRERAMRTARNGVQHIQYFRAKLIVVDGAPVLEIAKGKREPATATMVEIPSDAHAEIKAGIKEVLVDLRIMLIWLRPKSTRSCV